MGAYNPKIDAYIEKSADFAKPVLNKIRELVHEVCPDVEEAWKWSFPCYLYKGEMFCQSAAFKSHCSFGFWKSTIMPDPYGLLSNEEGNGHGNFGKITSLSDLPSDAIIKEYMKAAMDLNDRGIKVAKAPKTEAKALPEVPETFAKMLAANSAAQQHFENFSPSKKREYLDWFYDAKSDATRQKRYDQAIEWIAEGKARNWKYENC